MREHNVPRQHLPPVLASLVFVSGPGSRPVIAANRLHPAAIRIDQKHLRPGPRCALRRGVGRSIPAQRKPRLEQHPPIPQHIIRNKIPRQITQLQRSRPIQSRRLQRKSAGGAPGAPANIRRAAPPSAATSQTPRVSPAFLSPANKTVFPSNDTLASALAANPGASASVRPARN